MSDKTTATLEFTCFKCNHQNSYPHTIQEGMEEEGARTLVKLCQNCGIENKLDLPDGWVASRDSVTLRGQ